MTKFFGAAALARLACLALMLGAMPQAQAGQFTPACAVKDIAAITLIEQHAAAEDVPADRLGKAGLTLLSARMACYDGRVADALALYDMILGLGPFALLSGQRP